MGKRWPQYELQGLTARDIVGEKVILPIWYDIGFDEIVRVNPPLAQKLSLPLPRSFGNNDLARVCVKLVDLCSNRGPERAASSCGHADQ
jgi:hypothetical protein